MTSPEKPWGGIKKENPEEEAEKEGLERKEDSQESGVFQGKPVAHVQVKAVVRHENPH